jgi:transposase
MTAANEDTVIAVDVVPGQDHDAPHLEAMLGQTTERLPEYDQVIGDKGFDGEAQRQACRDHGATPVIPYKSNSTKTSKLDKRAYRQRNKIERLFGKLKEFRRVATRYEKLKQTFLAMIHIALGFIRLRKGIVNRA